LLYTTVGIPLARFADVANRVWIMTVCVALWSLMTALCGLATEVTIGSITIGVFWILLMCRVGVGIGEAGCTPPANSLIADYFIPRERSQALGIYNMGVTLGTMVANLVGGWVTDMFDRRTAFFVVRSEEHTSELQSRENLVCRLLLEKKKIKVDLHGIRPRPT